MDNDTRRTVYLRERSTLTPPQRRRIAKHDHNTVAEIPRALRRSGRRQVLAAARIHRLSVRARFSRRAA